MKFWKPERTRHGIEIAAQIVAQTVALAVLFATSVFFLMMSEIGSGGDNSIENFEDAVHFLWSVVTTVGYGHRTINTRWGRVNVILTFLTVGQLYRSTECLISRLIIHELGHRVVTWEVARTLVGILVVGSGVLIPVVTFSDYRSVEDSFWFIFITITTIGLGDQVPPTGLASYFVLCASSFLSIIYYVLMGWADRNLRCFFNNPIRQVLFGNLKRSQSFLDDLDFSSNENFCTSCNVLSTGMIFPLDEITENVITIRLKCQPSQAASLAQKFEKKLKKNYPDVEVKEGSANDYATPGPFLSRTASFLSNRESGRCGSRFEMDTIAEMNETIISTVDDIRTPVPLVVYEPASSPDSNGIKALEGTSFTGKNNRLKGSSSAIVASSSESIFQDNAAFSTDNDETESLNVARNTSHHFVVTATIEVASSNNAAEILSTKNTETAALLEKSTDNLFENHQNIDCGQTTAAPSSDLIEFRETGFSENLSLFSGTISDERTNDIELINLDSLHCSKDSKQDSKNSGEISCLPADTITLLDRSSLPDDKDGSLVSSPPNKPVYDPVNSPEH